VVFVLEAALTAALIAMVVLAIIGLVIELSHPSRFLDASGLGREIDHALEVFVILELLATAMAYLTRHDVVRRILEAALVAIARKLIAIDLGAAPLATAGALAILLIALTVAWRTLVGRQHTRANDRTQPAQR
jgi:uncharacterized membrane protein (DUF373 family)